ncbi:hypothetical protein H4S02_007122 [Coemansia sp. RSA 2611]|nr:hypothetical protein H4S02_007122 [Coemansia sp. RSA 2611]
MTGPEGNKRPRADNGSPKSIPVMYPPHQHSPVLAACETQEAAAAPVVISTPAERASTAALEDGQATRALLERLLLSHEQLATDVARLQQTVDTVLLTLRQSSPAHPARDTLATADQRPASTPRRTSQNLPFAAYTQPPGRRFGAVPPSLANIVSPQSQAADPMLSERPPASESPQPQYRHGGERARAASSGDAAGSIADGSNVSLPPVQRHHAHEYLSAGAHSPAGRFFANSPPMLAQPTAAGGSQIALPLPAGLPPSAGVPRNAPLQGFPRVQSPTSAALSSQGQGRFHQLQSPSPSAPLSAPSSSSSAYPPTRHSSAHHGEYRQSRPQPQHGAPLSRYSHLHYDPRGAPVSPLRAQPGHGEQAALLQPLMRTSVTARPHGGQYPRGPGLQKEAPGTSPYSAAPAAAAGMLIDATPAPKPSPPLYPQAHAGFAPPLTSDGAGSGGMVESPTGSGAAPRSVPYAAAGGGGGGHAYGGSTHEPGAQQKLEKNRFQANIRAFVDQHFMVGSNLHWDYQQSFKAPHNAETTQQITEAFQALHGNPFERIQHGLGVYFSSLKAKHRSSEEKTMVKQQRDRRRARRIKKANGRRKVFDRAQYPFLTDDFDSKRCFIPLATSPEHTDDDGEVKVGVVPWRMDTYTKLFHHLDTMRTKRTIRPVNAQLSSGSVPPPEIPDFMIDPAFLSMDRARRSPDPDQDPEDHNADPEEDIEMGSSSDGD